MATKLIDLFMGQLDELRYQPVDKHVRASRAGSPVADSWHAVLVWEPRRLTPIYAVPAADIAAELAPAEEVGAEDSHPISLDRQGPPLLDPRTAFAHHTSPGTPLTVTTADGRVEGAAFRLDEPELDGYVAMDFAAFEWLEEDEGVIGHPQDPFHRVDVRRSSRSVRLELDGMLLAESSRPSVLFETMLPFVRYYLPAEDVLVPLRPSATRTRCAYKGEAAYWSVDTASQPVSDLAWSYAHPLRDAADVGGMVCFFHERLDLTLDGRRVERPHTPWS